VGGTSLILSNTVLSGPGGLIKTGSGTLSVSGGNTFSGDTLVNAGMLALAGSGSIALSSNLVLAAGTVLDVSARIDGKLTLAAGQTLSGTGTINGSLVVGLGATLSPGPAIGTLTVTNAATLQGTASMKLNKAANTNDSLRGAASIAYGGTLSLTNLAGALAPGDSFRLFNGSAYSGAFSKLLPPMAGSGLAWDTSGLLNNGTLRVAVAPKPVINSVAVSGANLVLSGTNGVPGATYYVLTSTNLTIPVAAWPRIATNLFDAIGTFAVTNQASPSVAQQFYILQLQ
jgi:autotransporter-associated beta strand protein